MSNESQSVSDSLQRNQFVARKERLYAWLIAGSAVLTILVTVGIILALSVNALTFWSEISPIAFFTGTNWSPKIAGEYGVLPLVSGTLLVTVCSALIALPVGLAAAIYLSEYASERVRSILKPALEVLAGVPTVIYGYMALVYVTPLIDGFLPIDATVIPSRIQILTVPDWLPAISGFVLALPEFTFVVPSLRTFNALSASIVVGIMIIPMVSSISEDALSAVPDSLREAAYGLGSTKFDVSTKVVVPSATSGIVASYVLALSRAIGETMAVTMAMGMSPQMPYFPNVLKNLAESSQTMTAAMVQIAGADSLGTGPTFEAMFALGMTLFAITLTMNVLAELVRRRFREAYE
ncbi:MULTISPECIES: phosphate ABC transporter permease subunit PstC [Halomicrobium]|uniref:Phosphate transport system permease protein n=2 Tax=Halomicrobium mukohataei TaxID=57705 RepID=C7NXQ5_HALMD|nr:MULTISPECIES: phosphate ABC transporter permease subunit PstC [Halomicrobium]ACV46493.1 phosphate ABC transporter, inner membrane subunit PstC [Halomicrobium mukohataei DSM 12286]QCD65039.1 phosphate ABC transporter permease subunit PstC [Halomicrobium mukohataei]QFR19845.1 phosphate ABC transporter permease subunit PstC [Halomicrobium sp. ZPS1]